MKSIRLFQSPTCWIAEFNGDEKEKLELFKALGTNQIPTPFLPSMPYKEVQNKIQILNPQYAVK